MAELIPSFLFSSRKDKRYFLFHPNLELNQRFRLIQDRTYVFGTNKKKQSQLNVTA